MKKIFGLVIGLLLLASSAFAGLMVPSGGFTARQYTFSGGYVYGYILVAYTGTDDPVSAQVLLQDGYTIQCPSAECTLAPYSAGLYFIFYPHAAPGIHFQNGVVWATIIGAQSQITVKAFCDSLNGRYCNGPD